MNIGKFFSHEGHDEPNNSKYETPGDAEARTFEKEMPTADGRPTQTWRY